MNLSYHLWRNVFWGPKPLPEPVLTTHLWGFVELSWWQFHRKYWRYISMTCVFKWSILHPHLLSAHVLKKVPRNALMWTFDFFASHDNQDLKLNATKRIQPHLCPCYIMPNFNLNISWDKCSKSFVKIKRLQGRCRDTSSNGNATRHRMKDITANLTTKNIFKLQRGWRCCPQGYIVCV